jgi:wyosine [tRNA(Phe)-imidazoG37] synthetase (radical SAM superfamily)
MQYPMPSAVYGPVKSWRFGNSLGVDMLVVDSICSFNCVYCQLGNIHQVIDEQKVFYPTERIIADLAAVDPDGVDIVTFSGSGEPTLALNIGEVIDYVHDEMKKPSLVLTNSTWLFDAATRKRLRNASIVDCKLDAASDEMLQKYNRVAKGVTLERILRGIRALRDDPDFKGSLTLQCMFMPMNLKEAEQLAALIRDIKPDEVQLNTPRRPHPKEWYQEARGNHDKDAPVETVRLKTITEEQAQEIEKLLAETTGVPIRSIYRRAPK